MISDPITGGGGVVVGLGSPGKVVLVSGGGLIGGSPGNVGVEKGGIETEGVGMGGSVTGGMVTGGVLTGGSVTGGLVAVGSVTGGHGSISDMGGSISDIGGSEIEIGGKVGSGIDHGSLLVVVWSPFPGLSVWLPSWPPSSGMGVVSGVSVGFGVLVGFGVSVGSGVVGGVVGLPPPPIVQIIPPRPTFVDEVVVVGVTSMSVGT